MRATLAVIATMTNKLRNILVGISLLSYLLIMLNGSMIVLPFGLYILFSLADFGTLNQLTALLALTAFVIVLRTSTGKLTKKWVLFHGLAFILLCTPLINRLTDVPIELFNYGAFIIPLVIFVILYLATLLTTTFIVCRLDDIG